MTWTDFHKEEEEKEYFKKLWKFLDFEYSDEDFIIYPPKEHIYRAFNEVPVNKVRVVILGQDPYHGSGQANGLAFAVNENEAAPPSLKNIMKESQTTDKTLLSWAKQGVLLLNNVLTVRDSRPKAHSGKGWEIYTKNAIKYLLENSDMDKPLIFCLWGRDAETKRQLIEEYEGVTIISTSHPSPLAANKTARPFLGSDQFIRINDILKAAGEEPINF